MERTTEEHVRLVAWFAGEMIKALERNDYKPHWLTMTRDERSMKRHEEQRELSEAVEWKSPSAIIREAVDVALCVAFEADAARARMEGEKGEKG